jgi:hypothetical protein
MVDGPAPDSQVISLDEVRRLLDRAGLPVTPQQARALTELVQQVGSVHAARLVLEAVDALRDAA